MGPLRGSNQGARKSQKHIPDDRGASDQSLNFETSANQSYLVALEIILYIGFLIAFAVKSPIIPLHTSKLLFIFL